MMLSEVLRFVHQGALHPHSYHTPGPLFSKGEISRYLAGQYSSRHGKKSCAKKAGGSCTNLKPTLSAANDPQSYLLNASLTHTLSFSNLRVGGIITPGRPGSWTGACARALVLALVRALVRAWCVSVSSKPQAQDGMSCQLLWYQCWYTCRYTCTYTCWLICGYTRVRRCTAVHRTHTGYL